MGANNLTKNVIADSLKDIKVELDSEFDSNFDRKAFFSRAWQRKKYDNGKGSLLVNKGVLRRSVRSRINGTQLAYSSSEVYAAIHNEGGEITLKSIMKQREVSAVPRKREKRVTQKRTGSYRMKPNFTSLWLLKK